MSRPELPNGLLGAQPKLSEMKMKTDSHKDAEFKVSGDNSVEIKLDADIPVKTMGKLVQCGTDKEFPEYVFIQRKNPKDVRYRVAFPEKGWYKFQIFALEENDPSNSLFNVYNYLINVESVKKAARPYPKVMTKFYDECCYLDKPLVISPNKLDKVDFELKVPGAEKVAVHCVEEWFHLSKDGDEWKGSANLAKYKGKGKVSVMANYDKDSTKYNGLLEYSI